MARLATVEIVLLVIGCVLGAAFLAIIISGAVVALKSSGAPAPGGGGGGGGGTTPPPTWSYTIVNNTSGTDVNPIANVLVLWNGEGTSWSGAITPPFGAGTTTNVPIISQVSSWASDAQVAAWNGVSGASSPSSLPNPTSFTTIVINTDGTITFQ